MNSENIEHKYFNVGDEVEITSGSWHIKEYPQKAVIAEVMHEGFSFRCQVDGFEWLLGPFCSHELQPVDKITRTKKPKKKSFKGFFNKDSANNVQ